MKSIYVSDLKNGTQVDGVFLVSSKKVDCTKGGSPYMRLKLTDRTGTVEAVKWDADESELSSVDNGQFVHIWGVVGSYKESLQVKIDSLRLHTDKVDPADYLPQTERDTHEMLSALRSIVATVEHPQLKALLDYFFTDNKFVSKFSTAPAAQKIHHGYIGGLLEHTLSVAQLCSFAAEHFPGVDRSLLITGAILHDVGKIEEFNWDAIIKYADNGHLIGHVVGGAAMVDKAISTIDDFDPLLRQVVLHIILSHHGQKEYGAPKRPKVLEAIIIHFLEDLDAKVNIFQRVVNSETSKRSSSIWTERDWVFDRPLFKGLPTAEENTGESRLEVLLDSDYDPFDD